MKLGHDHEDYRWKLHGAGMRWELFALRTYPQVPSEANLIRVAAAYGAGWQDQWARIGRWRERVRQSRDDGRTDSLGTEGYRDEMFALLQALWHLKDWLKNDLNVAPTVRSDVEPWIESKGNTLKVAADVANGSKHLLLTGRRAGGSDQTRNDVTIAMGVGVKHVFYVGDARTCSDQEVLMLADDCLSEWTAFLSSHSMTPPTP